jgi:hypothetical protein
VTNITQARIGSLPNETRIAHSSNGPAGPAFSAIGARCDINGLRQSRRGRSSASESTAAARCSTEPSICLRRRSPETASTLTFDDISAISHQIHEVAAHATQVAEQLQLIVTPHGSDATRSSSCSICRDGAGNGGAMVCVTSPATLTIWTTNPGCIRWTPFPVSSATV